MPAHDQCEEIFIHALEKDGWLLIDHPYAIKTGQETLYADLRLRERENQQDIIVVEVKCFSDKRSDLDEFYHAIGQVLLYREALAFLQLNFPVYLAIPESTYQSLFQRTTIQAVIKNAKIKIITIRLEDEVVSQWID